LTTKEDKNEYRVSAKPKKLTGYLKISDTSFVCLDKLNLVQVQREQVRFADKSKWKYMLVLLMNEGHHSVDYNFDGKACEADAITILEKRDEYMKYMARITGQKEED